LAFRVYVTGALRFYGARPILFRRSFRTAPGLPKPISEQRQSVMLFGFVNDAVDAFPCLDVLMLVFCVQVSLIRMFKG